MRDDLFESALNYLWSLASTYGTGRLFFRKTKQAEDLLEYKPGKDVVEVVKKAQKLIQKAVDKIPVHFVEKHYRITFPVDKFYLDGMRNFLGNESGISSSTWREMKDQIEEKRNFSDMHISLLRKHKMLLTPEQLHKTFLSDRLASILHSRARQVLYLQNEISTEEQKRYRWYMELGIEFSKLFFPNDPTICSMFGLILIANNRLPLLLQNREGESDHQFLLRLNKAKELANKVKNVEGFHYEHGRYKKVHNTGYGLLNVQKYLVKANTKIYKRRELAINHPFPGALQECDELFHLAKENSHFVMAANCRAQAGKYYAASRNYPKAIEAFDSAFDEDGKGIKNQLQDLPNSYAWAVYNYANALHAGWNELAKNGVDLIHAKRKFDQRYSKVTKERIKPIWKTRLDQCKAKLEILSS